MTLEEIQIRIMLEAGEFMLTPENHEIDQGKFARIVKMALAQQNKHSPIDRKFKLYLDETGTLIPDNLFADLVGAPCAIADIMPLKKAGASSVLSDLNMPKGFRSRHNNPHLARTRLSPWTFRPDTGMIHVPVSGDFELTGVWDYVIEEIDGEQTIRHLEDGDVNFFDWLTAKFLNIVSRNRRAFTLQPLEITTDADTHHQETKEMLERAEQNYGEQKKWWLACRG
jgi:hypothetical protein